jgi:YaeC family lipoprotein
MNVVATISTWWNQLVPNWGRGSAQFWTSLGETLSMTFIAGVIAFAIGLALGVVLVISKPGGLLANRPVYKVLDNVINILRSVPFLILIFMLFPVTRLIMGTATGVAGAIVPLVIGTVPFFARQVEVAISEVSPGLIEAAQSMGLSTWQIITRVFLRESISSIVRVTQITFISLVSLTVMAGAVGAGGLGNFAIQFGLQRGMTDLLWVAIVTLLLFVSAIQAFGNLIISFAPGVRRSKPRSEKVRFVSIIAFATAGITALALIVGNVVTRPSTAVATTIRVGVTGQWNDHWYHIAELVKPQGINIELVSFSDFVTPNRALANGDIDLNAFQHKAFLAADSAANGYQIEAIADTFWGPLNIFGNPNRVHSLSDIKDGARIGIPSDPTNGGRALRLLEATGLITLDTTPDQIPSILNIAANPKNLHIVEAESGLLFSLLPDLDAAVINAGNAITAGLSPTTDGIFGETEQTVDVEPLINVIAARSADLTDPARKAFFDAIVDAHHTDSTRQVLLDAFGGAYIPIW